MFSCEYCENFQKSVLYRILSVAASDKTSVETRSLHILIPLSSLDSQYAYWIKFHQGHFASSLDSQYAYWMKFHQGHFASNLES